MSFSMILTISLIVLFVSLDIFLSRQKGKTSTPTGRKAAHNPVANKPEKLQTTEYFEAERSPKDGLCSDNECPCPQVVIPRGSGYLYISKECVEFHRDARTLEDLERKIQRTYRPDFDIQAKEAQKHSWSNIQIIGQGVVNPILICEQGARLRKLNLDVAAADAKYWWETGKVPLRATPIISDIPDHERI